MPSGSSKALDRVICPPGADFGHEALLIDFAKGSSTLRPEHEDWIQNLGKRLMRDEAMAGVARWDITAIGSASQTGTPELNMGLSIARAEAAVDAYVGLMHRPHAVRTRFLGVGKAYPIDPKIQENGRDRCVHFAVGIGQMLVPAPPKTVDLDLAEAWKRENLRRHKLFMTVDRASETGIGISKFLFGVGYSTLTVVFTVTSDGTGFGDQYTFRGSGKTLGWSGNPLPMDGMRTSGRGEPHRISVHKTIDIKQHFVGKATVDVINDGVFLTYRDRHGHHRLVTELKLPSQIQAPSVTLVKQFNGYVYRGNLR